MRVYYVGRKESVKPSQPASDLRAGFEYVVKEIRDVDGQKNFIIKGMPEGIGYCAEWFKVLPVYLATSSQLPIVGETLKGLTMIGRGISREEETSFSKEKVLNIIYMGGDVYEVHLKYMTLVVEVF